jgi:hypothetical protein
LRRSLDYLTRALHVSHIKLSSTNTISHNTNPSVRYPSRPYFTLYSILLERSQVIRQRVRIFPLLPPCGISVSPSLEDLLEIPSHQTTGAPFFVLLFAASPLTEKPSGYPRLSDSGCAFFFPFFFAVWCCRDVAPPRCRGVAFCLSIFELHKDQIAKVQTVKVQTTQRSERTKIRSQASEQKPSQLDLHPLTRKCVGVASP